MRLGLALRAAKFCVGRGKIEVAVVEAGPVGVELHLALQRIAALGHERRGEA